MRSSKFTFTLRDYLFINVAQRVLLEIVNTVKHWCRIPRRATGAKEIDKRDKNAVTRKHLNCSNL